MKKTFEAYPTFHETDNKQLQTWNRCATFFNIGKDINLEEAKNYARQFNLFDKQSMFKLFSFIEENGYEYTKALVNKGEYVLQ